MSEHIVSIKVYVSVFITLLLLTALTTAIGFIDMGRMNTVVALAIAILKASLVFLFFMHLRYSNSLTRLVLLAGLFWLAILLSFTLADVLTRGWVKVPQGWNNQAAIVRQQR